METTIELEIPLVLPGVENEKDECLARLETALQNRKGLLRAHLENFKVESRLAIAVGTIDFIPDDRISAGDGQAFQKSGRLLENIPKYSLMTFAIAGQENTDIHSALEIVVLLLDTLAKRWTARQSQAVADVLQGWTQEKIANNFMPKPISQQAVAQHLERAEWPAIGEGLKIFEQCLKNLSLLRGKE